MFQGQSLEPSSCSRHIWRGLGVAFPRSTLFEKRASPDSGVSTTDDGVSSADDGVSDTDNGCPILMTGCLTPALWPVLDTPYKTIIAPWELECPFPGRLLTTFLDF